MSKDTQRPGRHVGVVTRITDKLGNDSRVRGFVFLTDANGDEYFAHKTAFANREIWAGVDLGAGFSFRITSSVNGVRAFDVLPAREDEQALVAEIEERYGPKTVTATADDTLRRERLEHRARQGVGRHGTRASGVAGDADEE